jgi:anti-sigma factor RsiW
MKSYLQKLENNEAILLMYLADELPPQDRTEVEQMLASDARMRGELEILRQTQRLAYDALGSLDAITRPPVAPMAAQNRISQMVRLWVERRRHTTNAPVRRRIPWVRSGFAAAAALMLGYYIWAVYHTAEMHGLPPVSIQPHELTDNEKLAVLYNSFEISNSESSDLVEHVAEVASVAPSDAEDTSNSDVKSDSNSSGAP